MKAKDYLNKLHKDGILMEQNIDLWGIEEFLEDYLVLKTNEFIEIIDDSIINSISSGIDTQHLLYVKKGILLTVNKDVSGIA